MTIEQAVDLAFFVQDFNTKAITSLRLKELHGVSVNDRTDLIEAVKKYFNKVVYGKQ